MWRAEDDMEDERESLLSLPKTSSNTHESSRDPTRATPSNRRNRPACENRHPRRIKLPSVAAWVACRPPASTSSPHDEAVG